MRCLRCVTIELMWHRRLISRGGGEDDHPVYGCGFIVVVLDDCRIGIAAGADTQLQVHSASTSHSVGCASIPVSYAHSRQTHHHPSFSFYSFLLVPPHPRPFQTNRALSHNHISSYFTFLFILFFCFLSLFFFKPSAHSLRLSCPVARRMYRMKERVRRMRALGRSSRRGGFRGRAISVGGRKVRPFFFLGSVFFESKSANLPLSQLFL